ncbi:MAG TPA: hypothetical protein VN222_05035 [Novosphingobium sp.]|nr:hypothetical protein [Novosphingobium sp.]HZV10059.1 hypothetical protein [Novosphingobium sp.]
MIVRRGTPAPQVARLVDFERINRAALAHASAVLRAMLPGGRAMGAEYVAVNPRRGDKRPGSFKVNVCTGKWADFASGDAGGDLVSLCAYLVGVSQREAGLRLAEALGVSPWA